MSYTLGSYSTVSDRTQAWLSTPVISVETKATKGKGKGRVKDRSIIIYQLFDTYAKYETDPEWAERFRNYAAGIFPRWISFKPNGYVEGGQRVVSDYTYGHSYQNNNENIGGVLTAKKNKKIQNIELSPNIAEGMSECKEFLIKSGVTPSAMDVTMNNEMIEAKYQQNILTKSGSANAVPKGRQKIELLNRYYNELSKHLGLNEKEKNILISDINIAFDLKQLDNNNIIMNNGEIYNITGLTYDPVNKRMHAINQPKTKRSTKQVQTVESSPFTTSWVSLVHYMESQKTNTPPKPLSFSGANSISTSLNNTETLGNHSTFTQQPTQMYQSVPAYQSTTPQFQPQPTIIQGNFSIPNI